MGPKLAAHFSGIFRQLVAPGLDQAVEELREDPRRVYSIECMFFLRLFWECRPELQEVLRDLLNTGRLRLTGSGVTTPDTLLPSAEAILRDMLLGQEWLRAIRHHAGTAPGLLPRLLRPLAGAALAA